ncbi:MAG: ribonucleoside-diphosphate reductase subunit alpha [Candidatus Babeliales bacterium]
MEQEFSRNSTRMSYPYKKKYIDSDEKKIHSVFSVKKINSIRETLDLDRLYQAIAWASLGYESVVDIELIVKEATKNIFDGISTTEIADALTLATIAFVEQDPAYGYIAARLLFKKLFKEVTNCSAMRTDISNIYKQTFITGITEGVSAQLFDNRMLDFDLNYLAAHLEPKRDFLFDYMGLRTLHERYFIQYKKKRVELPQTFWMRVAMGLSYNEKNKNEKAVAFYNTMSTLRYVPSTPTLLHAGLTRPQLSSCFLSTVEDDLQHIFKCFGDNAQLSKWSGGVANDWSNIRAVGAIVNSIKTESQGVIPFLKIVNDTTAAINRSGKRRGATVVYLETWHLEVEDFLDLRKNTGDERRRTHDINTANWIPDLFMKRVIADENWTLFSPEEVPDLHDLYGKSFEKRYQEYEKKVQEGEIALFKIIPAKQLWRKMISRLFETGHPWITFKDPCNIRSPQDHVGVVHCSNLCTEITLNTSAQETAVCNLGSINLARHTMTGTLDNDLLAQTVSTAMCMLDNVIDINFYPTKEAQTANFRHRPVGLGLMGFQDALYQLNINFTDPQAGEFADEIMEKISYHAILTSSKLAKERGTYASYDGSKWDRNIFPQDTIALLEQERGIPINIKKEGKLDWTPVRVHVQQFGMRNSNTMAIAPTATIANISGVFPSIEPIYKNMYVKANMNGEFTIVNKYLIKDLQKLGLWDQDMLDQIKYYDGNLQSIARIPQQIKAKYKEAFSIDPLWLIEISAARGKWIDQSQSHNVFMQGVSGKKLSEIYISAWQLGLKTTYYLRTLGASQIEKSTLDAKKFGFTQKRVYTMGSEEDKQEITNNETNPQSCNLMEDPSCEACQ